MKESENETEKECGKAVAMQFVRRCFSFAVLIHNAYKVEGKLEHMSESCTTDDEGKKEYELLKRAAGEMHQVVNTLKEVDTILCEKLGIENKLLHIFNYGSR